MLSLYYNNKKLKIGGANLVIQNGKPPVPPTPVDPVIPYNWKINDFNTIEEVYSALQPGDKVAFVIRHSERGSEELTEAGIKYAKDLGAKLIGGIANKDDIALYSTNVNRTRQTAQYIAQGRGDSIQTVETDKTSYALAGQIYVDQKGSGWEDFSLVSYGKAPTHGYTFLDIPTITEQIIDYVESNMDKTLNLFITHDQLLEILTITVCNRQISLRFWDGATNDGVNEKRWITYLAGIAIIKRPDDSFEIYPVKGLPKGYQTSYDSTYR